MLYDGALKFMHEAEAGFNEENLVRRIEIINNNLIKAQKIINELQNSIDMAVGGDLPRTLNDLYEFCFGRLEAANLKKDPAPIREAYQTISDLRSAWAEMLQKQSAQTQQTTPSPATRAQPGASDVRVFQSA